MEDYFLKHSVLDDKESDEIKYMNECRLRTREDDEGSEDEEPTNIPTYKSVNDPSNPWIHIEDTEKIRYIKEEYWKKSQNTGPKGVVKDYKDYKRAQYQNRMMEERQRNDILLNIAKGNCSKTEDVSGNQCLSDEEDEDQWISNVYAKKRFEELKAQMARNSRFGSLSFVSPEEMSEAIDKTINDDYAILVHLYDKSSQYCACLNTTLEDLAKHYPNTQVLAVESAQADASITINDVPILLFYRNGKLADTKFFDTEARASLLNYSWDIHCIDHLL